MRIPGLRLEVDSSGVEWRQTGFAGVRWYLIDPAGSALRMGQGRARDSAVLIEMEPGRGYPAHRHRGVEEVLVLRGGYRDEGGEYHSGDYVRYEAGSRHTPVALGEVGDSRAPVCLLYAIAREGIEVLEGPG